MNKISFKKIFYPGKFIAIEGRDGTGKTTLTKFLVKKFREKNIKAVRTKFPTKRVKSSKIFQLFTHQKQNNLVDPLSLQVLHMSDRIQHTHEFITPNLELGNVVISDRYITASLGIIKTYNLPTDWFINLCHHLWQPTIWIWLYAPSEIAINRIKKRPKEQNLEIDETEYNKSIKIGIEIAKQQKITILNTLENSLEDCWKIIYFQYISNLNL